MLPPWSKISHISSVFLNVKRMFQLFHGNCCSMELTSAEMLPWLLQSLSFQVQCHSLYILLRLIIFTSFCLFLSSYHSPHPITPYLGWTVVKKTKTSLEIWLIEELCQTELLKFHRPYGILFNTKYHPMSFGMSAYKSAWIFLEYMHHLT